MGLVHASVSADLISARQNDGPIVCAHYKNFRLWQFPPQIWHDFKTARTRHADIKQYYVGPQFSGFEKTFRPVAGLAADTALSAG
jgi:hypothetical protein